MNDSPNTAELDAAIVAHAQDHWRKVAMVIAMVIDTLGLPLTDEHFERIGKRIVALVGFGRVESQGDVSRWRHSEVRRPRVETPQYCHLCALLTRKSRNTWTRATFFTSSG